MIQTTAIRDTFKTPFIVTWNTGRRCNLDCTYCEDTHHNNYSKHKSLDDFKNAFNFVDQWTKEYNADEVQIWFTGGEPTVNPDFWNFLEFIPEHYFIGVTTNGAWGPTNTQRLIKYADAITISYHAEADSRLKLQIIENIFTISESSLGLQVNLMMHMDFWDECVELYHRLKDANIKVMPRPIGDGNILRKGWFIDGDGNQRRTSHEYTEQQQQWYFNVKGIKYESKEKLEGSQLGRSCCGGRCLEGKINNEWKPISVINTEFKGWYCSVDNYFLHIDQETDLVYHHQTCQVLPGGKKGPIGHLSESTKLLQELKDRLSNPQPMICPNLRCGCGMCVPKAAQLEDYKELFK